MWSIWSTFVSCCVWKYEQCSNDTGKPTSKYTNFFKAMLMKNSESEIMKYSWLVGPVDVNAMVRFIRCSLLQMLYLQVLSKKGINVLPQKFDSLCDTASVNLERSCVVGWELPLVPHYVWHHIIHGCIPCGMNGRETQLICWWLTFIFWTFS